MFRFYILAALFLYVFFISGNVTLANPPAEVLRLAYPDFPPFHWKDNQGQMRGIFYEILTEALERRMQQHVVWTAYPWARCQQQVKAGSEDAIITVPTRVRNSYTKTHQYPFFDKPLHLFTYADHPRFTEILRIKSLAGIKTTGLSVLTYSTNGWHRDHVAALGIKTMNPPTWRMCG